MEKIEREKKNVPRRKKQGKSFYPTGPLVIVSTGSDSDDDTSSDEQEQEPEDMGTPCDGEQGGEVLRSDAMDTEKDAEESGAGASGDAEQEELLRAAADVLMEYGGDAGGC